MIFTTKQPLLYSEPVLETNILAYTIRFTAPVRHPLLIDLHRVSECANVISTCMKSNRLQLNTDKTEILWYATGGRYHHQMAPVYLIVMSDPVSASASRSHLRSAARGDLAVPRS